MFCQSCGNSIPDGSAFCQSCGAPAGANPNNMQQMQYNPAANQQYAGQPNAQYLPMNWYNFLVYFGLWAGGLLNIVGGFQVLTGAQYSGLADFVYEVYGGMRILDIVAGLAIVGLGAWGIYTAVLLLKMERKGTTMVVQLYTMVLIVRVAYAILASAITHINLFTSSNLASIVIAIPMVFANKVYFEKRSHLFH